MNRGGWGEGLVRFSSTAIGHESSAITERRYIHLFDRQRTGCGRRWFQRQVDALCRLVEGRHVLCVAYGLVTGELRLGGGRGR